MKSSAARNLLFQHEELFDWNKKRGKGKRDWVTTVYIYTCIIRAEKLLKERQQRRLPLVSTGSVNGKAESSSFPRRDRSIGEPIKWSIGSRRGTYQPLRRFLGPESHARGFFIPPASSSSERRALTQASSTPVDLLPPGKYLTAAIRGCKFQISFSYSCGMGDAAVPGRNVLL